jgi:hypothetical protein
MFLSASLALLVLAPAAYAQERSTLVIPERESLEVMLLRTSASSRCQNCVIRGAPYAGELVVERVQVLADGNRIVERSTQRVYRDGDGRGRVESEWQGRPLVQIQDPVQAMSYRLYPADKTGLGMAMGEPKPASGAATATLAPAGGVSAGAAKVAEQLAPALAAAAASADSQRTVRSLGKRQIEGLTAEGTLETVTIPAGTNGNTRPIVSTYETWVSRDLRLTLYTKSTDPRYGERVIRLQNIGRTEPPTALFTVPADYKVQEIARR